MVLHEYGDGRDYQVLGLFFSSANGREWPAIELQTVVLYRFCVVKPLLRAEIMSRQAQSSYKLALRHRINAGRVAIRDQTAFFGRQFGQVASEWKADDTRVTFADFAISEKLAAELRRDFPHDDFCSEEASPLDETLVLEADFA